MTNDIVRTSLDIVRRRKLSDLAYREGLSDAETLRRLIDRAYEADLEAHADTMIKPGTQPPPVVG
jgi:hypothetical protein